MEGGGFFERGEGILDQHVATIGNIGFGKRAAQCCLALLPQKRSCSGSLWMSNQPEFRKYRHLKTSDESKSNRNSHTRPQRTEKEPEDADDSRDVTGLQSAWRIDEARSLGKATPVLTPRSDTTTTTTTFARPVRPLASCFRALDCTCFALCTFHTPAWTRCIEPRPSLHPDPSCRRRPRPLILLYSSLSSFSVTSCL